MALLKSAARETQPPPPDRRELARPQRRRFRAALTIAPALAKQSSPQSQPGWAGLMATLVAAMPMLGLFMVFGGSTVNSIGFSGIK
jgi:hypothetical protein